MYRSQLRNNSKKFNSLCYKFHVVGWFSQIVFIAHCKTLPSEATCGWTDKWVGFQQERELIFVVILTWKQSQREMSGRMNVPGLWIGSIFFAENPKAAWPGGSKLSSKSWKMASLTSFLKTFLSIYTMVAMNKHTSGLICTINIFISSLLKSRQVTSPDG